MKTIISFFFFIFATFTGEVSASMEYRVEPSEPMVGQEVEIQVRDAEATRFRFASQNDEQGWGRGTYTFTPKSVGTQQIYVEGKSGDSIEYYSFPLLVKHYKKQYLSFEASRNSSLTGQDVLWTVSYFAAGGIGGMERAEYRVDYDGDGDWDTSWQSDREFSYTFNTAGRFQPEVEIQYPDESMSIKKLSWIQVFKTKGVASQVSSFDSSEEAVGSPILNSYQTGSLVGEAVVWEIEYPGSLISWDVDGDGEWETQNSSDPKNEYAYRVSGVYSPRVKIKKGNKTTIYNLPAVVVSSPKQSVDQPEGLLIGARAQQFSGANLENNGVLSKSRNLTSEGVPSVEVNELNEPREEPAIKVLVSQRNANPGDRINFNASDTTGDGLTYYWKIDGKLLPQRGAEFGVRFRSPGVKSVDLMVEDASGERDKVVFEVNIIAKEAVEDNRLNILSIGYIDQSRVQTDPIKVYTRSERPNGLYAEDLMQGF